MERFVAFSQPFDVFIFDQSAQLDPAAVAGLPQVADTGQSAYLVLAPSATAVEAAALVAFAAIAAIDGLLIVGQALSRQVQLEAAEHPTLLALGMTRGQVVLAAVVRAGAVAFPGAVLAVAAAVAASPLAPIGFARRAEIDPGVAVDGPLLFVGGLTVAVAVLARAALAAWRPAAGSRRSDERRPSRAIEGLTVAGVPFPTLTGVAMALDQSRRGDHGLVRSALVGTFSALVTVLGVATLGHTLVTSARRRRRDLAVLRAIGFARSRSRPRSPGRPRQRPSCPGRRPAPRGGRRPVGVAGGGRRPRDTGGSGHARLGHRPDRCPPSCWSPTPSPPSPGRGAHPSRHRPEGRVMGGPLLVPCRLHRARHCSPDKDREGGQP